MNALRSIVMAFAMFTRVPMPRIQWKDENMQYMLAAYPLVGLIEGLLFYLWRLLAVKLSLSPLLFGAGLALIPLFYTGGVNMDGFCDTVDALSSFGDLEKKRTILKDSHVGAFGAMYAAAYFLFTTVLAAEGTDNDKAVLLFCLVPAVGRALSGFAGTAFPVYGETGLLFSFNRSAKKKAAAGLLVFAFALGVAAMAAVQLISGLSAGIAAFFCGVYVYKMSKKQFGGMSGDIAGYLLQIAELVMFAVIVLTQKAVQI